ncbi:hypothetical protein KFV08_07815 [Macrococcoides canis]|uniref:hypothetical protein n=1 Tax=Macrococcoides canis TaxID=1855823 RepID=UPI00207D4569|nr:hypothetical protein [Macrococcus canis]MCO4095723.1 hypothetical protein [Macrococcus canis]UTH08432.1 hypothetical protein KFV08_07815 [Macrococcus canis]
MRNIQLADDLIKKTFGEDYTKGIERKRFDATDKHVTWSTEFAEYDASILCTVSQNGMKFKVSADDVPDSFVIEQFNKVKHVREELFKEEEDDQLTIDDVEIEEQVTLEGTDELKEQTSDDDLEELSEKVIEEDK